MNRQLFFPACFVLFFTSITYSMDHGHQCPICHEMIESALLQDREAVVDSRQLFSCNHATLCHASCMANFIRSNTIAQCPVCQQELRTRISHLVPAEIAAALSAINHPVVRESVFGEQSPVLGPATSRIFARRIAAIEQQYEPIRWPSDRSTNGEEQR